MCYAIYSYGLPSTFIIIVYIIDKLESTPTHLRPQIGVINCFFHGTNETKCTTIEFLINKFNETISDWLTKFLYFYLPLGVVMILNAVLFSMTAITIRLAKREATTEIQENSLQFQKNLSRKIDK